MPQLPEWLPIPIPLKRQSRAHELKSRLDWGEPALTIIDVRERSAFQRNHILGALSIPADELAARALTSIEQNRDVYVYGETDEETLVVADQLRALGFHNVSALTGGVAAWKAVGYPIEGTRLT